MECSWLIKTLNVKSIITKIRMRDYTLHKGTFSFPLCGVDTSKVSELIQQVNVTNVSSVAAC